MSNHTPEQRRRNMQAIKSKDSKIEFILRRALYHKGYRYRKNSSQVYGHPDILFIKEKIAIFCDSEFWHGYDWENRKNDFKSNQDFWISKIARNMERDREVNQYLEHEGYIVLRFWGNQIKRDLESVIDRIDYAIKSCRKK